MSDIDSILEKIDSYSKSLTCHDTPPFSHAEKMRMLSDVCMNIRMLRQDNEILKQYNFKLQGVARERDDLKKERDDLKKEIEVLRNNLGYKIDYEKRCHETFKAICDEVCVLLDIKEYAYINESLRSLICRSESSRSTVAENIGETLILEVKDSIPIRLAIALVAAQSSGHIKIKQQNMRK